MGRAFEFRRERKEKRWDKMAKTFTKYGKLIAMAVKAGGSEIENNAKLRVIIQNAKGENMPKDRIENAIARASSKDADSFSEVVYEGYGPYGIGILVECATDNPTRTVANVRMYFNRNNGELGKTGSLDFAFIRRGVFRVKPGEHKMEDLEFSLIDFGLEEIYEDEGNFVILTAFQDFGLMQKGLEEFKIELIKAESQRIPNTTTKLTPEQEEEILDLIDKFEQDDDVSAVYHTMGE
jgi:YebC/PmpR family DNA-binding regulatory protein